MASIPIEVGYLLAPATIVQVEWKGLMLLASAVLLCTIVWLITNSPACANVRTLIRNGSALPGIACYGPPVIGALGLFMGPKRSLPAVLKRLTKLGQADGIAYAWVGLSLIVAIEDPVMSHEVLRRADKVTRDGDFNLVSPISSIRRILNETLFTHDNAVAKTIKDWTHQLVGKRQSIAEYNGLVMSIAEKHVDLFVRDHGEDDGRCSVHDMLDDFAADMWTQIFFGVRVPGRELRQMCATVTNMNAAITQPLQLLKHALWALCHPIQSRKGITDPVEAEIQNRIRVFVRELIIQGAENGEWTQDESGKPLPESILSKLKAAPRPGSSDAELEDELYDLSRAIIFAGFQSTRRWVGWTLVYLQQHPEIREELRNEIATPGLFELDSLRGFNKMKSSTSLFDAVLEEVGRLHAPTFAKFRVLSTPTALTTPTGKTVELAPDTLLILASQQMQTSEAIWGPDALEFRPHRFLEKATAETRRAYMPVGYGPRACPAFASDISMIGVKAFLMLLLPKYDVIVDEFTPVPGTMAEEIPEETRYRVRPVA